MELGVHHRMCSLRKSIIYQVTKRVYQHTDGQTDSCKYRQTNRQTHMERYKQTDGAVRHRQTYIHTNRQTERQTNRQTQTERYKQTDGQGSQTPDRQPNIQTQTDKHKQTDRAGPRYLTEDTVWMWCSLISKRPLIRFLIKY